MVNFSLDFFHSISEGILFKSSTVLDNKQDAYSMTFSFFANLMCSEILQEGIANQFDEVSRWSFCNTLGHVLKVFKN